MNVNYKWNYNFEIIKITDIVKYVDLNINKIIRTNIKGYKKPRTALDEEMIKKYINNYSSVISSKKQFKDNKKDIEAYLFKIKISNTITNKYNRSNGNLYKYIDELKKEIWIEDTPFIASLEKINKYYYLNILILDRFYYPEGKKIKTGKYFYRDKVTKKICSKENENAEKVFNKEKTILVSHKVRQEYIHYCPENEKTRKTLTNFIIYLKEKAKSIELKIINKVKEKELVRKTKKRIKQLNNGQFISIVDKFNEFDLLDSYDRRRTKVYNRTISLLELLSQNKHFKGLYLKRYKNILEDIKDYYIDDYEHNISILYDELISYLHYDYKKEILWLQEMTNF